MMICLLIYDFETANRIKFHNLDNIHHFLPLFRVLFDVMLGMLEILVSFICLIIFPLLALIIILFGIIRYMIRYIYDCFMMMVNIYIVIHLNSLCIVVGECHVVPDAWYGDMEGIMDRKRLSIIIIKYILLYIYIYS